MACGRFLELPFRRGEPSPRWNRRERFDPDAHDLFDLQLLKDAIQYALFRPPVHEHIDRASGQTASAARATCNLALPYRESRSAPGDWSDLYCRAAPAGSFDACILLFGDLLRANMLLLFCFYWCEHVVVNPRIVAQRPKILNPK
jgi:hypothetical protein